MKKLSISQLESSRGGVCGWGWCNYSAGAYDDNGCRTVVRSFRLFWLDTGVSDRVEECL